MRIISVCLITLLSFLTAGGAFATTGDTLKSVAAPNVCPQGLTFDGEQLWCLDRKSDMIYRIHPESGNITDSLPTPGYSPEGLTWDGSRLWCIDAGEESIFAIDPRTRIVEKTIYCPVSRPTGLTWDGDYLWVTGSRGAGIHQIDPADGTTIKEIPSPHANSSGLAFDGRYLWVSDRGRDMIYMVTPERGDVIFGFAAPAPHARGLAFDGEYLWNVDYQTDRIYKMKISDDEGFTRTNEKRQVLEFTHQVRNFGPDSIVSLDVYLAVPHDMDNQKLLAKPVFDPLPTGFVKDQWGQKVAHWCFENLGPAEFTEVVMRSEVALYETQYFVFPDRVGALDDIPGDIVEKYLVDDRKFSMGDPVIQKAVKAAVGEETNPYWIARNIFDYIIEHIEYELSGGWNLAPTVLDRGNGSCSEYSFVYISMCRAAGLPARYVGSVVVRGDDACWDNVFHRWVEIYLPGYGWMPVDPSGGDQTRPADQANYFGHLANRFLITTSGGGGSDFLDWGYNANEKWTSRGRCKIVTENIGEWSPLGDEAGE